MPERGPPTSRREAVASKLRKRGRRWLILKEPMLMRDLLSHPAFLPVAAVATLFVLACAGVVWLARGELALVPGRVMDQTRTVRVEFTVKDEAATRQLRELKQAMAPRVYRADQKSLETIENSVRSLPAVLASAGTPDKVVREVSDAFALTPEQFEAVKGQTVEGQPSATWNAHTDQLMELLERTPLLGASEHQLALQEGSGRLELRTTDSKHMLVSKEDALNVQSTDEAMRTRIRQRFRAMIEESGFNESSREIGATILQRLGKISAPLFTFDREGTQQRKDEEADTVAPVRITHKPGETIFRRGERLDGVALELARRENEVFHAQVSIVQKAMMGLGLLGIIGVLAGALGGYLGLFYRPLVASPGRIAALAGLMVVTLGASIWGALTYPSVFWFASLSPTVFLAMICVIAYDRRLVLAVAGSQAILVGIGLELPMTHLMVVMVGVAATAWQLSGVRHRNDVIRAGLVVSASLAVALLVAGLLERPQASGVYMEILRDAAWALAAGFFPAVLTLALLPTIERIFDITTGMTLSELRDPKSPLLRMLAERAPGTNNHSHTVATIAESAAEAIGADGLHVYVGALYHDIGKMNKPEYFVENQQGGVSRHSKLSPAMSLLVIVGHVKDGVELAREYKLPQSLHHYIESHHGTTLVEYFYDAAKRQAEDTGSDTSPREIEYRYPGPRPRTREAAILMLCDAIESATRAMPEPTPARISSLVHAMAAKRLADGQFDECELTLRDLSLMEEAIIKSLCSIYHTRIAYPRGEDEIVTDAKRQAIERTA